MRLSETTKAEARASPTLGIAGPGSGSINKLSKLKDILEAPTSETIVIPIFGLGGVGKTTLARYIYNHKNLENYFHPKVWVCVSDHFDILGVTKAILEKVDSSSATGLNNLNTLQERLKEKISRQRFLIVLDDIWNEDYKKWQDLFVPLKEGRSTSVVIVTTRSEKVAKNTGTTSPCHLDLLKHDECVSIFAQHALGAKDFSGHPDLKGIGEKIVSRCNGLPLAAAALGGLLRNEDPIKWKEVYDSSLWNVTISKDIIPALGLSYHYLPSQLKRCFAYFSVFPKDHEFDEEELILLWMAEGFFVEPKGHKQMEDLGHEYFRELLSRSLLQQSRNYTRSFVMHDLIHDLAQIVAGRVCFRMEDKEAEDVDIEAVLHLSSGLEPNKFELLKNTKRLRTLLALPTPEKDDSHSMNEKLLHNLLPQLRYLRVLSLRFCQINELPSSVGDLKHLRYLDLSHSSIKFLPESLCGLYFLQYLILRWCRKLQQLPLRLKELANLHYLDISNTEVLQELPPHLDLKNFPKLTRFVVGRSWGDAGIYSLAGGLRISMDKVKDEEDAHVMDLMNMKNVQELEFNWGKNWKAESQVQILNLLGTGKMLRNLVIRGYCGVTLPNWIGDSSYSNELYGEASSHGQPFPSLTELCIARCENLRTLPDGIMSSNSILQVLEIEDCQSLESFGSGVLPSTLKKLSLRYLSSLPEGGLPHGLQDFEFGPCAKVEKQIWDELAPHKLPFLTRLCINGVLGCEGIESFPFLETPNLTHLQIRRCRNLKYLPSNLPKLTSLLYLCVVRCHNLVSLPEGGLPPGLQDFEFRACAKVEKQMWDEWAPYKLPCLKSLSLSGKFSDVVCFPIPAQESQSLLPPGLTSLSIEGFSNLESLSSSAFQNLTSLAKLRINLCPKLQSLPIEALPPSLGSLDILKCPELKPKCEEGGEYWPRLSLIPKASIDQLPIRGRKKN